MSKDLKLGLQVGYWAGGPPPGVEDAIAEAEKLGFDSIWTAEAYGSDAISPLAWWGSRTERMRLGTAILQLSARQPAAMAMAAMTMDHLSGGRFICGLGVSGPQVVEGWYGMPFAKPLARTREYIEIMRAIWAREAPLAFGGEHYPLPLPGGTGLGKPLKSLIHPLRSDIPIFLAAQGPKNVALAAEMCEGWHALFFSPHSEDLYKPSLEEGFARPGARVTADQFEVAATVPFILTNEIDAAADSLRPMYALYFGGMGAKSTNFHANVPIRMGYEAEVDEIQRLYLEGKKDDAAAKVPRELIEKLALIGPKEKVRDELEAWRESIATMLLIGGDATTIRAAAELVLG